MKETNHIFEDGETVRIKEMGEVATVDYWWYANSLAGQYNTAL
ncbi:hypothetical protein [Bacillus cereus]|nr:hypothetical protein [Bacillus cereus]